ncbi:HAD family hydrolase [Clostridium sp. 'White wine YQ']|uniref:HAD family hydrolase n=1 Tax=Clostridium sp. 'White wine YQ' TaxID=3027474 RepID=UPI00236640FA|nr:HAD family hydrolase [Clostridium sp. 'White wine YQ']MDD7794025.1 HAD family hydrolase [Clostridium sp. 'White wine YQ']
MIKLIASDMDGTLLNSKGQLPKDFFKIAKKVLNKGVVFVAASGRPYHTLRNNFHEIKDDILFLAENGAYVMYKGKELYSSTMSKERVHKIIEEARKVPETNIVLCGKKRAYIENSDDEVFMEEFNKYYHEYEKVDDLLLVEDDIIKVSIHDKLGSAENSNNIITPVWGEEFQITVSGQVWLDIGKKGINKGKSLRTIQRLLGVQKEETMVFGDYYNDVEMLGEAYYSYAMKNAPEDVKSYSRFIAKTNDEEGVIQVIREKVLKEA